MNVTSVTDIANIVNYNRNNVNDCCECEADTSDVYQLMNINVETVETEPETDMAVNMNLLAEEFFYTLRWAWR